MANVFVKADYGGIELRILAEISKDKEMINAFNNNIDLHLLSANRVFNLGIPSEALVQTSTQYGELLQKFAMERTQVKAVNFGIIYGAYPKRFADDFNVPIKEAQRWINSFHELYPGVQKAIDQTKQELWDKGYVTTLMGRRRRFPQYRDVDKWEQGRMLRQTFNFRIQGTSADIGKIAGIRLSEMVKKYDALLVLFAHDEYVIECPEKYAEKCAKEMEHVMANCVSLSVPLTVSVNVINNYGE